MYQAYNIYVKYKIAKNDSDIIEINFVFYDEELYKQVEDIFL